ncbi:Encystation-mediating serine proteinase [Trichuris trichiura]|uniref:Encystation-mediating serine proteinase n=1 Tax=Trichuris trichiura TaxID=36087 RepID=A0A077YYF4_TRITR|nr:Encystation-mediating serine proteinase [Trichuris trichiura]
MRDCEPIMKTQTTVTADVIVVVEKIIPVPTTIDRRYYGLLWGLVITIVTAAHRSFSGDSMPGILTDYGVEVIERDGIFGDRASWGDRFFL